MITPAVTVTFILPISDAPEVKGSAAYLVPTSVEWRATRGTYSPGRAYSYTGAWCDGAPSRSGGRRRGTYYAGDLETAAGWVPRPPEGWLTSLDVLVIEP